MPTGIYDRTKSKPNCGVFKKGSQVRLGIKHTNETRIKMSISHKGKARTTIYKSKKFSEEHLKNLGISHKGEKAYNYIKDRSKLKVSEKKHLDVKYKDWMLTVKKRDNWKCKIADENCSGRLEAHHILSWRDYPELRYKPNNGITLCHAHHPRKRAEEKRLSPYFMELVSVSKE